MMHCTALPTLTREYTRFTVPLTIDDRLKLNEDDPNSR